MNEKLPGLLKLVIKKKKKTQKRLNILLTLEEHTLIGWLARKNGETVSKMVMRLLDQEDRRISGSDAPDGHTCLTDHERQVLQNILEKNDQSPL